MMEQATAAGGSSSMMGVVIGVTLGVLVVVGAGIVLIRARERQRLFSNLDLRTGHRPQPQRRFTVTPASKAGKASPRATHRQSVALLSSLAELRGEQEEDPGTRLHRSGSAPSRPSTAEPLQPFEAEALASGQKTAKRPSDRRQSRVVFKDLNELAEQKASDEMDAWLNAARRDEDDTSMTDEQLAEADAKAESKPVDDATLWGVLRFDTFIVELRGDGVCLGRNDPSNPIVVERHGKVLEHLQIGAKDSEFLSAIHCTVYHDGDDIKLTREPECRNGLWLNDGAVDRAAARATHTLSNGDRIMLVNQTPLSKKFECQLVCGTITATDLEPLCDVLQTIMDANAEVKDGCRVWHNTRGAGTVLGIYPGDERNKPYHVRFDAGDEHHYSETSMLKFMLLPVTSSEQHGPRGMRRETLENEEDRPHLVPHAPSIVVSHADSVGKEDSVGADFPTRDRTFSRTRTARNMPARKGTTHTSALPPGGTLLGSSLAPLPASPEK